MKHRIDRNTPPPRIRLEYGAGVHVESSNKLIHKELFDGATLVARYEKITVYVEIGNKNFTINASLV